MSDERDPMDDSEDEQQSVTEASGDGTVAISGGCCEEEET
jgi:hypothetical protein